MATSKPKHDHQAKPAAIEPPAQQPSVVVASGHVVFRRALAEALAAYGVTVLAEGGQGPESVTMTERHKPDVLIVDVEMWGAQLADEIEHLRELSPKTQVVITTRFDSPRQARELLAARASAYLGKSATMEELLLAVWATKDPQRKDTAMMVVSKQAAELSDREVEILSGIARGLSNQQLASALNIAESTVKRHLSNAYEKMGVHSRGEALRKALQEGLITVPEIVGERGLEE
jgi:DNA-binding NarL/FixJ family response regulator